MLRVLSWPVFSIAAVSMVSRLKAMGVAPRAMVDIGANIGQFAVAAERLLHDCIVVSIEPNQDVAKKLKKNLNGANAERVRITAVGEETGFTTLNINSDSQVSSVLPLGRDRIRFFPDSTVTGHIRVPVAALDSIFKDANLPEPILVKIDVQGAEASVLRGGKEFFKRVSWVIVEVSFGELYEGGASFHEISELLHRAGFTFVRPLDFHLSPTTNEIIEMDALFAARADWRPDGC